MRFLRIKHKTPKIAQRYYKKCTFAKKMSKSLLLSEILLRMGCICDRSFGGMHKVQAASEGTIASLYVRT